MAISKLLRTNFRMGRMGFLSTLCGVALAGALSTFADEAARKPVKVSLWGNHAPVGDGTFQDADATITVHPAAKLARA